MTEQMQERKMTMNKGKPSDTQVNADFEKWGEFRCQGVVGWGEEKLLRRDD